MTAAARVRPMALDGRSTDAALEQTVDRVTAVQSAIVRIYSERGALTLNQLEDAYGEMLGAPPASPASIRSRAAELKRRGILAATNLPAKSRYGRPATALILASRAEEASCLFS